MTLLLITFLTAFLTRTDAFFAKSDQFFRANVQAGNVKYLSIAQNPAELQFLVKEIAEIDYQTMNKNERKSFLINTYNLLVINEIVQNYPTNSPQDIAGFFSKKNSILFGKKVSLDQLEKEIILKEFSDARLHFVLICAAKGCPKIANFAFKPAIIEEQINSQAIKIINDPDFIKTVNSKIELSRIFEWYEADFKANHKTVIDFINTFRNQKIPKNANTSFYDYDWTLNDDLIKNDVLNLQKFTPSALIPRGRWEYKGFNNFYTQNQYFDDQYQRKNAGERSNYNTFINQFLFGFKPNYNLGLDIWVKTVVSPFQGSQYKRTAVSGIGPKIKFVPFKKLPQVTMQSTLLLPIARDMTGRQSGKPFLSADASIWITQLFYDKPLSRQFLFFSQMSSWVTFGRNASDRYVATPLTFFVSYLPNTRTTFYIQNEAWPTWGWNGISSLFVQHGLGAKFQVIPGLLELESSATLFSFGKNGGAGQTLNVGFRVIR